MSTTKNGAGVQGAPQPKATAKPELSEISIPAKPQTKAEEKPKIPTVEERKHKAQLLESLIERYDQTKHYEKELESFTIGGELDGQTLSLRDTRGKSYSLGNPQIIGDVVKMVMTKLTEQRQDLETQILNFTV